MLSPNTLNNQVVTFHRGKCSTPVQVQFDSKGILTSLKLLCEWFCTYFFIPCFGPASCKLLLSPHSYSSVFKLLHHEYSTYNTSILAMLGVPISLTLLPFYKDPFKFVSNYLVPLCLTLLADLEILLFLMSCFVHPRYESFCFVLFYLVLSCLFVLSWRLFS